MPSPEIRDILHEFTLRSVDQGRIIEDGWLAFRKLVLPANAPDVQIAEMHKAFFAGAQHLFGSIMTLLEEGTDPTANDLKRMDLIHRELHDFYQLMKQKGDAC